MCLDDWNGQIQTKPQSQGGVRAYVHYVSCNDNLDQKWYWNGANNHELRNKASGGCLNALGDSTAPGTPLGVYSCNGGSNEAFFESQQPSSGGSGGSTETTGQ
ncbi:MAG TPA: RICIN domain-containing protein, partial [Candidatus Saccharimonadales bacterium]|nr:RICIN domain-containing protein [Candidatus Saccharimonadales bacterium]